MKITMGGDEIDSRLMRKLARKGLFRNTVAKHIVLKSFRKKYGGCKLY